MFPGLQSKVSFGIDAKDKAHFLSFEIPKESASMVQALGWWTHAVGQRLNKQRLSELDDFKDHKKERLDGTYKEVV